MQPFGENMYFKVWLISDSLAPPKVPRNSDTLVERDTWLLGGNLFSEVGKAYFHAKHPLDCNGEHLSHCPPGQPSEPTGQTRQCRWQNTAELAILVLDSSVSDSVGVGWSLQICILAKFPSDIDVNGPGTAL